MGDISELIFKRHFRTPNFGSPLIRPSSPVLFFVVSYTLNMPPVTENLKLAKEEVKGPQQALVIADSFDEFFRPITLETPRVCNIIILFI